jgi:hypothetical protein
VALVVVVVVIGPKTDPELPKIVELDGVNENPPNPLPPKIELPNPPLEELVVSLLLVLASPDDVTAINPLTLDFKPPKSDDTKLVEDDVVVAVLVYAVDAAE